MRYIRADGLTRGTTGGLPRSPHLQHPRVGAVDPVLQPSHVAGGALPLVLPPTQRIPSEACALAGREGGVPPMGKPVAGPGQGLEEVVEQTGGQGFVHPVAGQERVVDLVHAPDVPAAEPLLGLQACSWVCIRETERTLGTPGQVNFI